MLTFLEIAEDKDAARGHFPTGIKDMKIEIKRKVSVSLRLTEEEAHVISAGLYALARFEGPYSEEQGTDAEVRAFGEAMAGIRESLQAKLGEAGLWPEAVRDGLEGEYLETENNLLSLPSDETHEDWRTSPSTWHTKERGLPGITGEGEQVLQHLLTWAWKHPERWVAATCSRPVVGGGAYMSQAELDEHWSPHISFLVSIGRITPKTIDGQEGWIVPSAKEWRQLYGKPRGQSVVSIAQPVA
jgi:hypothetical protein